RFICCLHHLFSCATGTRATARVALTSRPARATARVAPTSRPARATARVAPTLYEDATFRFVVEFITVACLTNKLNGATMGARDWSIERNMQRDLCAVILPLSGLTSAGWRCWHCCIVAHVVMMS